jgi:N-acetylneuraminic acid mutarotase
MADHPRGVWDAASASVTNPSTLRTLVYVIGGRSREFGSPGATTSAVKAYDVSANRWLSRAPLPIPVRSSNGAVELDGKIYVSGGFTRRWDERRGVWRLETLRSLFVYDPASDSWTRRRDMPITSANGVSGSYRGMLYVATPCYDTALCGEDSERGALWRYNPATDRWVLLDRTPHDPWLGSGGFIGGKFHVVEFLGEMDIFDVTAKSWSLGPRIPNRACLGVSATLQARLYLLACEDASGGIGNTPMLVYDPVVGTWSEAPGAPAQEDMQWTLARVVAGGEPGLELIGGAGEGSNLQFLP